MPAKTQKTSLTPSTYTSAAPIQTIFVDRIMNVGVGMSVSKLVLITDTGENSGNTVTQLVIPTPQLFEAIEALSKFVMENSDTRDSLIQALTEFREQLEESGK